LAESLSEQTPQPAAWIVVDDGSTDDTARSIDELRRVHPWVRPVAFERSPESTMTHRGRGARVVPAFQFGVAAIEEMPAVVAKIDADISFGSDYFARLAEEFAKDPKLGIASGTCFEEENGRWRQRHLTGAMVWGAARAYRSACLEQVLPLEERMGWDGIDVAKANVCGWRTDVFLDLPFFHHRIEAGRERTRWHAWSVQGEACHYMGYRPTYLFLRTMRIARRDPAAFAMLWSYAASAAKRAPTCPDPSVRAHVRRLQRLRELPARRREAAGDRPSAFT
jgi:glycosyltransferase involved in cell wall biosynthesis